MEPDETLRSHARSVPLTSQARRTPEIQPARHRPADAHPDTDKPGPGESHSLDLKPQRCLGFDRLSSAEKNPDQDPPN